MRTHSHILYRSNAYFFFSIRFSIHSCFMVWVHGPIKCGTISAQSTQANKHVNAPNMLPKIHRRLYHPYIFVCFCYLLLNRATHATKRSQDDFVCISEPIPITAVTLCVGLPKYNLFDGIMVNDIYAGIGVAWPRHGWQRWFNASVSTNDNC